MGATSASLAKAPPQSAKQSMVNRPIQTRNFSSNHEHANPTRISLPHSFASIPTFTPNEPARFSPISKYPPLRLQRKLAIGAVDDPLEREADQIAEQVMRAPADDSAANSDTHVQRTCADCEKRRDGKDHEIYRKPSSSNLLIKGKLPQTTVVQRNVENEIQENLVRAFLGSREILQRKSAKPQGDQGSAAGGQIFMQAKLGDAQSPQPPIDLEARTGSLEGRGVPLASSLRNEMEGRFGYDFSHVRIHADAPAALLARQINARAFTIGRNIAFASEERAFTSTDSGRRLLAHELTHVVQQGQAPPRLQRKIVVAGKPYTPTARYLHYVEVNYGKAMREFVERMHNGGGAPTYSFSTYEQMGNEVRIRANAIKGIEEVHKGCCDYPDAAHPYFLNSTYWDHLGGVHFKTKSPLPAGKKPSDAIEAIFAPGAGTRLECLTMTVAIEYYSMLKAIGPAKFNAEFAAGIDISTSPQLIATPDKKYKIIAVASKSELLPGDWVYFKNFHDYTIRIPGGFWRGENAIYLGGGKYRGFGVLQKTENELNQELVDQYNNHSVPPLTKTVADLIADGGGLLLNPVVRPILSNIVP